MWNDDEWNKPAQCARTCVTIFQILWKKTTPFGGNRLFPRLWAFQPAKNPEYLDYRNHGLLPMADISHACQRSIWTADKMALSYWSAMRLFFDWGKNIYNRFGEKAFLDLLILIRNSAFLCETFVFLGCWKNILKKFYSAWVKLVRLLSLQLTNFGKKTKKKARKITKV